jgi:hypothetical protein
LAGSGGEEGADPASFEVGAQPLNGDDRSTGDPTYRGDTRHAGRTIHPDRAAPALALGAAAILDRVDGELVAENVEQGRPVVSDLDVGAVDPEGNG